MSDDKFQEIQYTESGEMPVSASERATISAFHSLYYANENQTWQDSRWMGVNVQKCPLDLFIYQEIIFETKPDLIIETGTYLGGSALFLAHLCDLLGRGEVVTIDTLERPGQPEHPRITYIRDMSTSPAVIEYLEEKSSGLESVLLILDSEHSRDNVYKELNLLSKFVTLDNYLIVEDTNVNGNPVLPDFGPGPHEAVQDFLTENDSFAVDSTKEKYYMTFNPGGYLKRIK